MRPIPKRATEFVALHESLRLEAYQDPGGAWTVGYGHTGPEVHAGLRIPRPEADKLLGADLLEARTRLSSMVQGEVLDELNENQYAALLSFVFNVGANPAWSIWKVLGRRQFEAVPSELVRFVHVGGKRLRGLATRRAAEVALWNEDGEAGETPSSFVRVEETPPTPLARKPLFQSKRFISAAGAGVLGAPKLISEASERVSPYAAKSIHVQHLVEWLATAGAFAAMAAAVLVWWAHAKESQQ